MIKCITAEHVPAQKGMSGLLKGHRSRRSYLGHVSHTRDVTIYGWLDVVCLSVAQTLHDNMSPGHVSPHSVRRQQNRLKRDVGKNPPNPVFCVARWTCQRLSSVTPETSPKWHTEHVALRLTRKLRIHGTYVQGMYNCSSLKSRMNTSETIKILERSDRTLQGSMCGRCSFCRCALIRHTGKRRKRHGHDYLFKKEHKDHRGAGTGQEMSVPSKDGSRQRNRTVGAHVSYKYGRVFVILDNEEMSPSNGWMNTSNAPKRCSLMVSASAYLCNTSHRGYIWREIRRAVIDLYFGRLPELQTPNQASRCTFGMSPIVKLFYGSHARFKNQNDGTFRGPYLIDITAII